jgi:ubiquinone/menaquinone biosynthesis C-methylase UbiE
MVYWIIGIVAIILIALYIFLDREIYFYEATHLGPRIQGWFYNRWAEKYDQGKAESQARDKEMVAAPVLAALKNLQAPLILDLATGTGRFPRALLNEPDFTGHVVAVDVSVGMLEQAAAKLEDCPGAVSYLRWFEFPLPFADNSFDLVSCLEALEVMPDAEAPLSELYRILRPGGLLISSRATEASGRKAKIRSVEQFTELLQKKGFEQIEIIPWWKWFDRVLARKPGQFVPGEPRDVTDVFSCPQCHSVGMKRDGAALACMHCGKKIPIDPKGIILG